jgi:hypothetical protein
MVMMNDCTHCARGRRDYQDRVGASGRRASGKFFLPAYAATKPAKAKAVILL